MYRELSIRIFMIIVYDPILFIAHFWHFLASISYLWIFKLFPFPVLMRMYCFQRFLLMPGNYIPYLLITF